MQVYFSDGQRRRGRRNFRIKIYGALGLFLFFFLGVFYFVNYTQAFKINVELTGLKRASSKQILNRIHAKILNSFWGGLLGVDNYLSWPKVIVLNEPLIAELEIKKDLWHKKIAVNVIERQPFGVFCAQQCYWFDKTGFIFEPAPIPDGHLILSVKSDGAGRDWLPGRPFLEDKFFKNFLKITSFFKTSGIAINNYILKSKLQEVHAEASGGLSVRFSLRFDPDNSLAALKAVYDKGGLKNAAYADLTVENRLYIKPR